MGTRYRLGWEGSIGETSTQQKAAPGSWPPFSLFSSPADSIGTTRPALPLPPRALSYQKGLLNIAWGQRTN